MKLEKWSHVFLPFNEYTAPELIRTALHGLVFGHPLHEDGKEVTTSAIVGVNGEKVRTSSGSEYELGEPDPAFEAEYPNARERMLARIREASL